MRIFENISIALQFKDKVKQIFVRFRYNCAPGLAFDPKDRVCKWADQVKACEKMMDEEEKAGVFSCPSAVVKGIYTKHAHPEDCRQYYVCISGTAREYGCPLGSVFKITQPDQDGICADPESVPECANYYGDLDFQPEELVKAGVDPEAVGIRTVSSQSASRTSSNNRVTNSFTEIQINDKAIEEILPEKLIPDLRATPLNFRNRPQAFTEAPKTTTTTTTEAAPVVEEISDDDDDADRPKPAVVKAGEDYYYYYYYYDDDEELPEDA